MLLLLLYVFLLDIVSVICGNVQTHAYTLGKAVKNQDFSILSGIIKTVPPNQTYIDKSENLLRVPNLNTSIDINSTKKKSAKKNPKRTLQKIIKKNRSRRKYSNRVTNAPTVPYNDELEKFYAQEEIKQRNENFTTTQVNQKKKRKSYNVARYPVPFKHFQGRKDGRRNKRNENNDILILTDLDEIEFLQNEKDTDVVKTHIQNHW